MNGTWTRQGQAFAPFTLEAADSGPSPSNPVVWRAQYPGGAVLSGGLFVPQSAFKPWADGPAGSLVADLAALDAPDTGTIVSGDLKDCQHNMSGVTLDDKPLLLSRWPNALPNGTWQFSSVVEGGSHGTFAVDGDRASRWVHEASPAIHGYWVFDWSDSYATITNISAPTGGAANLTISPAQEVKTKARYIGVNLLSELDDTNNGEFYFDRANRALYIMPPADATWREGGVWVSFTTEAVLQLQGASNVNITGLAVHHSRGSGVVVGAPSNVWLNDLDVRFHGANGTYMFGGHDSGVVGGAVSDCGCMGVSVTGGDFLSLTPGNMLVSGVHVSRMGQWKRTYQAGLFWGGVSNLYENMLIEDGPHNGVLGGGNEAGGVDCVFDGLTISHVASEVSDSGAFYTCGQSETGWVNPGIVIRNCHFEHIRNVVPIHLGYPSVQAIYLDDMMSWHVIENVSVVDSQKGFFIGGGRNTTVRGCRCEDVDTCIHVDDRGLGFEHSRCDSSSGDLWQGLELVKYEQPPWSQRFPFLASFNDGRACLPTNNSLIDNYFCGGQFSDVSPANALKWGLVQEGNSGTNGSCPTLL